MPENSKRIIYLDCSMGAAGDMLTAALSELLPNQDAFIDKMNHLGIPGLQVSKEISVKCGITGTHISVKVHGEEEESVDHHSEYEHNHGHNHDYEHAHEHTHTYAHDYEHPHGYEHTHDHGHGHDDMHTHAHGDHDHSHRHSHSSMQDIENRVAELPVSDQVKRDVLAVYGMIAEAESHVHGVPVAQIHFHEVGSADALADITAVCMLMEMLAPDEVICSPVHVGSGQVHCAHGILPVPAPATAYLLRDIPIYGGQIRGELCTPTGAALLRYYVNQFGNMPVMKTGAIGYGMGKKDFEAANCIRVMLGETVGFNNDIGQKPGNNVDNIDHSNNVDDNKNTVLELSCNVDDMTAEDIGFASEKLFEGGALEVYTIPIGMKKSRPGTLLRVMCTIEDREKMISLLFRHTTTIGVRETKTCRYVLNRQIEIVPTAYGDVRRKSVHGYGVSRFKYEYEDLARIAEEKNISLAEVRRLIEGDSIVFGSAVNPDKNPKQNR